MNKKINHRNFLDNSAIIKQFSSAAAAGRKHPARRRRQNDVGLGH